MGHHTIGHAPGSHWVTLVQRGLDEVGASNHNVLVYQLHWRIYISKLCKFLTFSRLGVRNKIILKYLKINSIEFSLFFELLTFQNTTWKFWNNRKFANLHIFPVNVYAFLSSLMHATCPVHHITLDLITLTILGVRSQRPRDFGVRIVEGMRKHLTGYVKLKKNIYYSGWNLFNILYI
jgi:hypothetical protein